MLYSAGYAVALYRRGDAYTYIRPQLLFAALGAVAMYMASRIDYHIWHKLAWPLLGISLALLVIVLFMPEYNGCKRWIVLPGLGTLITAFFMGPLIEFFNNKFSRPFLYIKYPFKTVPAVF